MNYWEDSKQFIMRGDWETKKIKEPRSVLRYVDMLRGHARWTCLREHGYLDMFTWTNLGRYVADYVHSLNMKTYRRSRTNRKDRSSPCLLRCRYADTPIFLINSGRKPKKGLRESFQVSSRSTKRIIVLYPTLSLPEGTSKDSS